jgi:thioredoxin 1
MKHVKYIAILLLLVLLLGCKGKAELQETAEFIQTEVVDSVDTELNKEEVSVQESKVIETKQEPVKSKETLKPAELVEQKKESYKVTFMEIGSVNCIPCKMMQPIMKEIEQDYSGVVKVEFYDLYEPNGRTIGQKYRIRVMPTQVFLDANGKEFFRHEGFYPKDELSKMLDKHLASIK